MLRGEPNYVVGTAPPETWRSTSIEPVHDASFQQAQVPFSATQCPIQSLSIDLLVFLFFFFVGILSVDLYFVEEGVSPSQVNGQPTLCMA